MLKVIKWLFILLIAAIVGLAIWGYTPDRDPKDLMEKYGQSPSRILPLPNGQKVHIRDEVARAMRRYYYCSMARIAHCTLGMAGSAN